MSIRMRKEIFEYCYLSAGQEMGGHSGQAGGAGLCREPGGT